MNNLQIASLNSGSNGNCYYIGNQYEAVLIDAGISCRETEKRMSRLGLSMKMVRAVLISHEHTDHTYGVELISRKYRIPVYMSAAALNNSRLNLDEKLWVPLLADKTIHPGRFEVSAFSKRHDSSDPLSFTVSADGVTVGIFTDIGSVCDRVVQHFRKCHAAFLEANYDESMLLEGRYPWFLKNRIRGDLGHLSNDQAFDLFISHRSPNLSHLLISHLSRDNNKPDLVLDMFMKKAGNTYIAIASRDKETPVFTVHNNS